MYMCISAICETIYEKGICSYTITHIWESNMKMNLSIVSMWNR